MCLICMKYRIIILIIIIISLGRISLSYIANTSRSHIRTYARTRVRAHTHTAVAAVQVIAIRWRPTVTSRSAGDKAGSLAISINTRVGDPIYLRFWMVFANKKLLGRTETRTRDRMYCQTTNIRTVIEISPETIYQELRPAV